MRMIRTTRHHVASNLFRLALSKHLWNCNLVQRNLIICLSGRWFWVGWWRAYRGKVGMLDVLGLFCCLSILTCNWRKHFLIRDKLFLIYFNTNLTQLISYLWRLRPVHGLPDIQFNTFVLLFSWFIIVLALFTMMLVFLTAWNTLLPHCSSWIQWFCESDRWLFVRGGTCRCKMRGHKTHIKSIFELVYLVFDVRWFTGHWYWAGFFHNLLYQLRTCLYRLWCSIQNFILFLLFINCCQHYFIHFIINNFGLQDFCRLLVDLRWKGT